ncbi:MAG: helix-turn-helix transcriptional regulator [Pseudomonadota bacterium]|nr:helix-turn-helix transcriptional regulator [Pseudomonadota bacterium]
MDWARTVRSLRQRLRLKQGAFAQMVGTSQTTVSRIEGGLADPTPEIIAALEKLRKDPAIRSTFDDFVASIEHSPYHCFLLDTDKDTLPIETMSESMRGRIGDVRALADVRAGEAIHQHVVALIDRGFSSGRIESAVGSWKDAGNPQQFWQVVYSPMRDGIGSWYVYATLTQISEADYEAHRGEHDGGLIITSYTPD